jgi:hypothetical protein
MKRLFFVLFFLSFSFEAQSNCSAPNEFVCTHFRNKHICRWGNLGCKSQKYFANPGASILNNFRKKSETPDSSPVDATDAPPISNVDNAQPNDPNNP